MPTIFEQRVPTRPGTVNDPQKNRRPIKTRQAGWAQRSAAALASRGVSPNAISLASILFAIGGALAILFVPTTTGYIVGALSVQLRLICNLLDGLVAVEGGRGTPSGPLFNEIPDRIADSVLLVALGYAAGEAWIGWLAALVAALTAYIRTLGGALGQEQDFRGPMSKSQRMFVMTVALLAAAVELPVAGSRHALLVGIILITAGSLATCLNRTVAIARRLRTR